MWTWERIISTFAADADRVRQGWEDAQINAKQMLVLIEEIRMTRDLDTIVPFLSHGTLCVFVPQIGKTISFYATSAIRCRISLHEDKGTVDSIFEYEIPFSSAIEEMLRIIGDHKG